jgi:aryl-alcohol dehydrogenase-like predicted oxidoreductase
LRYRKLGSTDLEMSEVGMAVAGLTGGQGPRADEDVLRLLRAALDLGITFFDTKDVGGADGGRGETLVGEAVRRERDRVTVATSFGYRPLSPLEQATSGERRRHDWSVAWAGPALDLSLSRLRLEPIDLWQLHHPEMSAIESDELFEFLDEQIAKGKIRAYGVALGPGAGWANEGVAALQERRVAAVRTRYSALEQDPGRELAAVAAETGAGIVARTLVDLSAPDPRLRHLDFLTTDRDQTMGQALVRFALALPGVAAVLPGFEDESRLAELAVASDLPDLTPDDLDRIAERFEEGFALPQRAGRRDVEGEA